MSGLTALAEPGGPWQLENLIFFCTNHMLDTLDLTGSDDWCPFNFPQSTALNVSPT